MRAAGSVPHPRAAARPVCPLPAPEFRGEIWSPSAGVARRACRPLPAEAPGICMSYRTIKRLLGETSLERKCRFLFGAFILLLITGSFWLFARKAETLAYQQIPAACRLLMVQTSCAAATTGSTTRDFAASSSAAVVEATTPKSATAARTIRTIHKLVGIPNSVRSMAIASSVNAGNKPGEMR